MKEYTKDIVKGFGALVGAVAFMVGLGWSLDRLEGNRKMRENIQTILDVNKDNRLSNEEVRRFYDETGLDVYSHPFNYLKRKELEPFIKNYEQVWVRKSAER